MAQVAADATAEKLGVMLARGNLQNGKGCGGICPTIACIALMTAAT